MHPLPRLLSACALFLLIAFPAPQRVGVALAQTETQAPPTASSRGGIELIPGDGGPPDCIHESRVNSFTASPSTIAPGGTSTVAWSVTLSPACNFPLLMSGRQVGRQGSLVVAPAATTTYALQLRVSGSRTLTLASRRVTVELPSVDLPTVVTIDCSTWACAELFVGAVGRKNTTVIVENGVTLDLSGREGIRIAPGVTVTGGRDARTLGPLLYTTNRPRPLLRIVGDDVRITGLRIRGADFGIGDGEYDKGMAISIDSNVHVEIANNEIAGWGGSAMTVADETGDRLTPYNAGAVYIHDNFIHHNQHEESHGYGVSVGKGAYARIERNVFDFNRHAITGDGSDWSGYWAHLNLVLKGGGIDQCTFGQCFHTQQFDMHGQDSCGIGGVFSDKAFNCGTAGHSVDIRYNAFQYTQNNAFRLRGTPQVTPTGAIVAFNTFAHSDLDDAVKQTERGLYLFRNVTGVDTFGEYGVCDFDADGRDDLFLATGQSFWYSSGGRSHWVFLKQSTRRLDRLVFGYFDEQAGCDVFAVADREWQVSSGGTGPWTPVGSSSVPFANLRFGDFNGDGRTDVFTSNGRRWSYAAPGIHGWRPLDGPGVALDALRLGQFDRDGITDVLSVVDGEWAISLGGDTDWQPISAALSRAVGRFVIADIEGDGLDDVLLYAPDSNRWKVSLDARGAWRTLDLDSSYDLGRLFWGRFDAALGADALAIDVQRRGRLATRGEGPFVTYSRFAY